MGILFILASISFVVLFFVNLGWLISSLYLLIIDGFSSILAGSNFTKQSIHVMNKESAMELSQKHGVPAGAVLDAKDSSEDPHLASRNFYQEAFTEDTGTYKYGRSPFLLSNTPTNVRRGPVMLGQDNEYVYKTILGISDTEYEELVSEGHIGSEFHPDIP